MKLIGIILVVALSAYYAGITVNRYLTYPASLAAVYEAEMVRDAAHKYARQRCSVTAQDYWATVTTASDLADLGYLNATRFGGASSNVTGISWQLLEANHNFIRVRALNVPDRRTLHALSTRFPSIQITAAVSGTSSAIIAMPVNYKTGQIGLADHRVFMQSEYRFDCNV